MITKKQLSQMKSNQGFTLLGIIVAIAIMSIVLALIFSIMGFGVKSFSYGSEEIKENADLRLTALKVTDKLRYAFDVRLSNAPPTGVQSQYIYCDTVNHALIYVDNVNGTTQQLSSGMDSATFAITKKTVDRIGYDDKGDEITIKAPVGYTIQFYFKDVDGVELLSSDVLLNNMKYTIDDVNWELDTENLNSPEKLYIGFNHSIPETESIVSILTPNNNSSYEKGIPIVFTATASDVDGGDLSTTIKWSCSQVPSINLDSAPFNTAFNTAFNNAAEGDGFTIIASVIDSGAVTRTDSITIYVGTIAATNHPPVATDEVFGPFKKGQTFDITLENANDPDDGDELKFIIDPTSTLAGTLSVKSEGITVVLSYIAPTYATIDSFKYKVRDSDGLYSETAEVKLTVTISGK